MKKHARILMTAMAWAVLTAIAQAADIQIQGPDDLRKEFLAQCGFCHQLSTTFLRHERSA
jgi:cytochrome c553